MEKDKMRDENFMNLLGKASKPEPNIDLTNAIMNKIYAIDAKKQIDKSYLRKSWWFVGLAIFLALSLLVIFSYFQATIISSIDIYVPGLAQGIIYFTFSGLVGWFLYQLNSIIALQFSLKP